MNELESNQFIERAADLLYRAGKESKKKLLPPEQEVEVFSRNRNLIKDSKEMNRIFNENAKAILAKIKKS